MKQVLVREHRESRVAEFEDYSIYIDSNLVEVTTREDKMTY